MTDLKEVHEDVMERYSLSRADAETMVELVVAVLWEPGGMDMTTEEMWDEAYRRLTEGE
jgi:hypothetical protein